MIHTKQMFYIKTNNGNRYVNSDELKESLINDKGFSFGVTDYSYEFVWDGTFLYPYDRDNKDDDIFDRVRTAEEMAKLLLSQSYGTQIIDAIKELKSFKLEIWISDALNHNDYSLNAVLRALKSKESK